VPSCHSLLARVHLARREYGFALREIQRALELNPNNQWNLADMGYMLRFMGEGEQSLQWSARARELAGECLALRADFAVGGLLKVEPFRLPAHVDGIAQALRLAGLPD
jgi:tetratricopeptide (TPR) repeat protein